MSVAHISVLLLVLTTFLFNCGAGKSRKPRWPIQDGHHLAIITSLLPVADLKARALYPPRLIFIAFILAKLWRGTPTRPPSAEDKIKPSLDRVFSGCLCESDPWNTYLKFTLCFTTVTDGVNTGFALLLCHLF